MNRVHGSSARMLHDRTHAVAPPMLNWRRWLAVLIALTCCVTANLAVSQEVQGLQSEDVVDRNVYQWLDRLQSAANIPAYTGTYVVSSPDGDLSSARIWHLCEGDEQLERIDTLMGLPRSTYRHNSEVHTFLPTRKIMWTRKHSPRRIFPQLASDLLDNAAQYYHVRELGVDRVAGYDSDVLELQPVDDLRLGHRIWSEHETGLVLKAQTLDAHGQILEQSAFSEIQMDVQPEALQEPLRLPQASDFERRQSRKTEVEPIDMGWLQQESVPGFVAQTAYRRKLKSTQSLMQWVFSDGLSTVSIFLEPFDQGEYQKTGEYSAGALHVLMQRWPDPQGPWWLALMGEVPSRTLHLLAASLDRVQADNL